MAITHDGPLDLPRPESPHPLSDRPSPADRPRLIARSWRAARALPSGRAVLGGLLVAVSTISAFALSARSRDRAVPYLVAAHPVAAGTVLTADDLASIDVAVPVVQRQLLVRDPDALIGKVATRSLSAGGLFGPGDVVAKDAATPTNDVAIALAPQFALGGAVRVGDRVSVFATYDACTSVVAADALVAAVSASSGGLNPDGSVITLRVADGDTVLAIVHAQQAGHLTMARSHGGAASVCTPTPVTGAAVSLAPTAAQG
jgi:hypothetical protein